MSIIRLLFLAALFVAPHVSAQVRIDQLPAGTTPTSTDPIPTVQGGVTVKVTPAQLSTYLTSTAGGVAGQTLTNYTSSFTGFSGLSASSIMTRTGQLCTIRITAVTGASNATTMTATGLPVACRPAAVRVFWVLVMDNGVSTSGMASIATNGTITFSVGVAGSFTASGTKGLPNGFDITYYPRENLPP